MTTHKLTVLSVRQPWASLLLTGEKWCENRSWSTKHRGRLWIHASMKMEKAECEAYGIDQHRLKTGAIIGVVDVVDVLHIDDLEERIPRLFKDYALKETRPEFIGEEYCWIVANPRALRKPIPAKGKLNLWRYEIDRASIGKLGKLKPLITKFPERSDDEDEYFETDFDLKMENGTVVKVRFFMDTDSDDVIKFKNLDSGEVHVVVGLDEAEYTNGSEQFQFACEVAWEQFPEFFES